MFTLTVLVLSFSLAEIFAVFRCLQAGDLRISAASNDVLKVRKALAIDPAWSILGINFCAPKEMQIIGFWRILYYGGEQQA